MFLLANIILTGVPICQCSSIMCVYGKYSSSLRSYLLIYVYSVFLTANILQVYSYWQYTAHTAPLFAQLQILPYELIVKQSKLLFMHSIEYSYAPSSFSDIWTKNYINH
jgi:hypothetical protein